MRLDLTIATAALLLTGCHKQPDAKASGFEARYQHERDKIQALGNGMQQELTKEIKNRIAVSQRSRYGDAPMATPMGPDEDMDADADVIQNDSAP